MTLDPEDRAALAKLGTWTLLWCFGLCALFLSSVALGLCVHAFRAVAGV